MKKWQAEDYREFELMQERLASLINWIWFADIFTCYIVNFNLL